MITLLPVPPVPPPLAAPAVSEGVKEAVKRVAFFTGAVAAVAGVVWGATVLTTRKKTLAGPPSLKGQRRSKPDRLHAAAVALTRAREFHYYIKTDAALKALIAAEKAYDRALASRDMKKSAGA